MLVTVTNHKVLPLNIELFGINHRQEPIVRSKGLPFFQMFICTEGKGNLIVNDKQYLIRKNDTFLLFPHQPHEYRPLNEEWKLDILGFSGICAISLLKYMNISSSVAYHINDSNYLHELLNKLSVIKENDINNLEEMSVICYKFLIHLAHSIEFLEEEGSSSEDIIISNIVRYIENNYANKITLEDIANHCELSKGYICTYFKKEMNQTVNEFIIKTRINKARIELLLQPNKKVYEIAAECGFQDSGYFGRVFKAFYKMSPEKYRKQ